MIDVYSKVSSALKPYHTSLETSLDFIVTSLVDDYYSSLYQTVVSESLMSGENSVDFLNHWFSTDARVEDLELYLSNRVPEEIFPDIFGILYQNSVSEMLRRSATENVVEGARVKSTVSLSEIRENLGNWRWRVSNLYKIVNKKGKVVPFRPNPVQKYVLDNLHSLVWILKSRRHGITTLFSIVGLDHTAFISNRNAAIVAHGLREVQHIFKSRVAFPYYSLPEAILAERYPVTNNTAQLSFNNGSMIAVSVSTRSGTQHYVLISELGILYWYSPAKAEEVVSGTLEAVHSGMFAVVESTAYGLTGYYERTMRIKKSSDETIATGATFSNLQYRYIFLPWYKDEDNVDSEPIDITVKEKGYLDKLQLEQGIFLVQEQINWYVRKFRALGEVTMWREHPSTTEESFRGSTEGAFFTPEVAKIYSEGRIRPLVYNPNVPLWIGWDLGLGDLMVLIFFQVIDGIRYCLHVYSDNGKSLDHYIRYIESSKFGFYDDTTLAFPHDITQREQTLKTGEMRLSHVMNLDIFLKDSRKRKVGDLRIIRVPRIQAKIQDIDNVRADLGKWVFNSEDDQVEGSDMAGVSLLLKSLSAYGRVFDPEAKVYSDTPKHNIHSHYIDALMTAVRSINVIPLTLDGLPYGKFL